MDAIRTLAAAGPFSFCTSHGKRILSSSTVPPCTGSGTLPPVDDVKEVQPGSWLDRRIEAMYRVARILHHRTPDKERAVEAYQRAVEEVGVVNFRSPDVVAGLHQLEARPRFPEDAILVWGGASKTRDGTCYRATRQPDEATRCYEAVLDMPDINWGYIHDSYDQWAPLRATGFPLDGQPPDCQPGTQ